MNKETENLMNFCKDSNERLLQRFLDMYDAFDEWKKDHPHGTMREWLDITYPKKEKDPELEARKREYLQKLQEEDEVA